MTASVYIATSLDGFIAREDGSLDWLVGADGQEMDDGEGGDYGYSAFMATIDALVMGRGTFEAVLSFGQWHYGATPVVVVSSTMSELPAGTPETVFLRSGEPEEVIADLAKLGMRRLYVDGGKTIQRFLAAGQIDRLIITRVPVLLGTGIPLFGPVPADIHLRHEETSAFQNGFVQSTYSVVK